MSEPLQLACVQLCAGQDAGENLRLATRLVRQAAEGGARLIMLPEAVDFLHPEAAAFREYAAPVPRHAALAAFRELARETVRWLHVGSLTARDDAGELVNRSFLLDPRGEIVASYDKIHMFDAHVPESTGESRESDVYRPGDRAALAATPWGALGMSICYDLRFPALFRSLAQAGAVMLAVPSAFMRSTGQAHWHVLLRARAIENGCFVIAAAQCGHHFGERHSFGHSLVVDPWGQILADGGESVGVSFAVLDLDRVQAARNIIGSLFHDRPYSEPDGEVSSSSPAKGGAS